MKRNLIPIICISLVLVFLSAGCISLGNGGGGGEEKTTPDVTTSKTHGLVVTDFRAVQDIYSNEVIDLALTVKNVGDKVAEDMEFNLYQKSGFKVQEGPEKMARLLPSNPETGTAGEERMAVWRLKAPDVSTDSTKYLKGSVSYNYSSSASTNIYLVPAKEYDESGAGSFKTSSSSSKGPVTIDIVEHDPYRKATVSNQTIHLAMTVKNTGNGVVETYGEGNKYEIDNFNVTIIKGNLTREINESEKCELPIGSDENTGRIRLFDREQARSIKCDFELGYDEKRSISYVIEVSGNYTYKIDTPSISINVREEDIE